MPTLSQGTGITGPVGARAPIQAIADLPGPIVLMEHHHQPGAAERTTEVPPLLQVTGARAEAPEVINLQEEPFQGAVVTLGHPVARGVPAPSGAVVALPEVRVVSEALAVVREVLVEPAGLQVDHALAEVVEGHKFQVHIVKLNQGK